MRKLREEYGKDAGWFRDTRAGGITFMFSRGIDAKVVMGLSGHRDIRSVMRYNKTYMERMKEAVSSKPVMDHPHGENNILQWRERKTA
jgi:integrase